jgi:hypothetical protein
MPSRLYQTKGGFDMAATTSRGSSSRPNRAAPRGRSAAGGSKASRSSSNGAKASTQARATTRGRAKSTASRKRAGSSAEAGKSQNARSEAAKRQNTGSQAANRQSATRSRNGSGANHGARETITNIVLPVATATLGVAGGVVLGRTALQRTRKVLGIPLPGKKVDLTGVSKQIGEAGRQFGTLAREVRTAREKAEKISRAIS